MKKFTVAHKWDGSVAVQVEFIATKSIADHFAEACVLKTFMVADGAGNHERTSAAKSDRQVRS